MSLIPVRLIQQEGPEHYRSWYFEGLDGNRLLAGLFVERRLATVEAGHSGWEIVEYRTIPQNGVGVTISESDARMRLSLEVES